MATLSKELTAVLDCDCPQELEGVLKARRPEDFQALQSLLSLDSSIKPGHRSNALYLLGRWGDPAPVSNICRILPQLNESGRISAIDALGRLGTREALTAILDYVSDPSFHVRKFVVRALGRINSPEAQTRLREIEAKDPVDYIRHQASAYLRHRRP
jgi:HEAT repeat protein